MKPGETCLGTRHRSRNLSNFIVAIINIHNFLLSHHVSNDVIYDAAFLTCQISCYYCGQMTLNLLLWRIIIAIAAISDTVNDVRLQACNTIE